MTGSTNATHLEGLVAGSFERGGRRVDIVVTEVSLSSSALSCLPLPPQRIERLGLRLDSRERWRTSAARNALGCSEASVLALRCGAIRRSPRSWPQTSPRFSRQCLTLAGTRTLLRSWFSGERCPPAALRPMTVEPSNASRQVLEMFGARTHPKTLQHASIPVEDCRVFAYRFRTLGEEHGGPTSKAHTLNTQEGVR
jgi:hypothetical protein